jgi:hypothetical protein
MVWFVYLDGLTGFLCFTTIQKAPETDKILAHLSRLSADSSARIYTYTAMVSKLGAGLVHADIYSRSTIRGFGF